jgi:hypothetical protein
MRVASWTKVENETTVGRTIWAAIVEGGMGAIAQVELGPKGWIVLVDRRDRSRRTIRVVPTLSDGQALVARLVAI